MSLPVPPNISQGQIALDPVNGIVWYRDSNDNLVSTTWSWLRDDLSQISTDDEVTIDSNLTIAGDLVVQGDTVSLNVSQLLVEDNYIILNSNYTSGSPVLDAGLQITRGSEPTVFIKWNELSNKWQFTNDGINFYDINSIVEDSVELGFHTFGDYVESISGGTGVTVSITSGEGVSPVISIGQDVSTSATPTFSRVIANLTGDVTGNLTGDVTGNVTGDVTGNLTGNVTGDVTGDLTGNVTGNLTGDVTGNVTGDVTGTVSDISNHGISDLSDVAINDAANGDFLRYNGSSWINDPVNLTTDTVGDYVATVISGTGISVTNTGGEGATPSIAIDAILDNLNDVSISGATPGQILQFDGINWVNSVSPTMEPIGFENKADSVISFNKTTREFSISPALTSYSIWCVGKKFTKTTTETIQIPNNSALHFIFFNSEGKLGTRESYFNWDSEAPTAYIYWNATDQEAYFFADERHGIVLDWATHEYLHRTRGAAIANGFGVNNFTITGTGASNSDAQIDIANGTFFDEDLQVDIVHSATPTANTWEQRLQGGSYIPVFYRLNNHWKKDTATQFPLKQGTSRPQYNLNSGGTWSTVDVGNNSFAISWIIATNNLNEPIIAVLGQNTYGDKGSAEANFYGSLDLAGFPIVEFRPLYKIIYECKNSYTNTPKAAFRTVSDLRSIISSDQGVSAVAVSDHGALTGLADDDHPQYLLADGTRVADSLTVSGSIITNSLILDGIEIDAATPSDTNVLKYSSALNKYIPGVASTVASLDDLTDVVISSATPNQVLKFDGVNWINAISPSSVEGTTYFATIGNGISSVFNINHGLTTRDLVVSFTDTTPPYASFSTLWEATTLDSITIYFETPPSINSVRVSIYAAVAGVAIATDLDSLNDVVLINSTPNDYLVFDGLNWTNQQVSVSALQDIGDVQITSATPNQVLKFDGTNWVNATSPLDISGTVYFATIGDGVTEIFTVNHNLSTRDVVITLRESQAPYSAISTLWDATDDNNVTLYFGSPPSASSIKVAVYAAVKGVEQGPPGPTGPTGPTGPAGPAGSIGTAILNDLSDVEATPSTGDFLKFNGSIWESGFIDSNTITADMLATGPARSGFRSTINAQTGTVYTLILSDLAKLVTMDNSSPMTLTVPTNSAEPFTIGDRVDILRKGSGTLVVQGDTGVTVNGTPGLLLRARWSSATLIKIDTDTWVLIGDLQA